MSGHIQHLRQPVLPASPVEKSRQLIRAGLLRQFFGSRNIQRMLKMNGGAVCPFHQTVVIIVVAARHSVVFFPTSVNALFPRLRKPRNRTARASAFDSLLENLPADLSHRILKAECLLHGFIHEQNLVRVNIRHI